MSLEHLTREDLILLVSTQREELLESHRNAGRLAQALEGTMTCLKAHVEELASAAGLCPTAYCPCLTVEHANGARALEQHRALYDPASGIAEEQTPHAL